MNEKEAVKDLKIDQIKSILAKLMSIYCWRPVMETDLVVKQVRKKPEVSRLDPINSTFYWGEKLSEREFTIIATFYEKQQVRKKCYALQIFHLWCDCT